MGPVATAIFNTLTGDAPLMAVLSGGIYDQEIDRKETPDAFTDVGAPLPAARVKAGDEGFDPFGIETAFASFPQVWFQATADDDGRDALEDAWELTRALLHGKQVTGPNGTGARLSVIGRVNVEKDPSALKMVSTMMRLQVAGLWAL
jgi:hypothetical protein